MEREIEALKSMGSKFFESHRSWVIDHFCRDLKSIVGRPIGTVHTLELQKLQTKPSDRYEISSRRGGYEVYAIVSGIWELRLLEKRNVEFCGKASTKILLFKKHDPNTCLAMWRMELGAVDSPGCYFHTQILGEVEDPPFPKSLPIPRLPSFFITPMSAIEFVLGELFQDDWAKSTASNSHWCGIQKDRFHQMFSWYLEKTDNAEMSPWMALKEAKPPGNLFLPR